MKKPRRGNAGRLARIKGFAVQTGKIAPRKSLWVLDTADKVLREIGKAVWLTMASLWRIPRALIARNSIERLESLEKYGKVLPARINLLVASFMLSLLLLSDIPEWMEQAVKLIPQDGLKSVLSVPPETMLGLAAPALLSIWATSNFLGRVLARLARVSVETPTFLLMQALSSVCMLTSIGSFGLMASFKYSHLQEWHIIDVILIIGLILLPMYLIASGGSWARQVCVTGECSPSRYKAVMGVSIFSFLASFAIALIGTNWLAQLEIRAFAALEGMIIISDSPAEKTNAAASRCFIDNDALICQFLLSIHKSPDVAVGALHEVDLSWYERSTMNSRRIPILMRDSQIVQLAPQGNPDGFTILRVKEPVPFSFRIAKAAACQLVDELLLTPEYDRFAPTVWLTFHWRPGFWLFAKAKSGFGETFISIPLFRNEYELFEFRFFCGVRPK